MGKKLDMVVTVVALGIVVAFWSCYPSHAKVQPVTETTAKYTTHTEVDFSISCMECHSEETPDIYEDWARSGHGKMNFGCYMCHGDGIEEFSVSTTTDKCISCHSSASGHLMRMENQGCFNCHDGHTLGSL